jgi:hypothetical protein
MITPAFFSDRERAIRMEDLLGFPNFVKLVIAKNSSRDQTTIAASPQERLRSPRRSESIGRRGVEHLIHRTSLINFIRISGLDP